MLGRRKKANADEKTPAKPAKAKAGAAKRDNSNANDALKNPCRRLGDILIEEGAITNNQLQEALKYQKEQHCFLGQALVELDHMDQDTLVSFLVKQCKIPHLNLLDYNIDSVLLDYISEETCKKYSLLPIDKLGKILTVAMVDPLDIEALEVVRESCPDLRVKPILCSWQHYEKVTGKLFGGGEGGSGGEADVSAESFGLASISEKPQAPEGEEVLDDAVNDAVSNLVQEAEEETAESPQKAPTPESLTPQSPQSPPESAGTTSLAASEELVSAIRDTLRETLGSFGSQLSSAVREVASKSEAMPTEQIASVMHDSVRAAMQESMAEFAQQVNETGRTGPESAPTQSLQELTDVIRQAMESLSQQPAPSRPDNDATTPSFSPDDLADAVRESVGEVMRESMGGLAEQISAIGKSAPDQETSSSTQDLAGAVSESVGGAISESMGALVEQINSIAGKIQDETPSTSPQDLAHAVHDSISSAMQESMENFSNQIQQLINSQPEDNTASTANDLAEAVRTSIQDSMRDAITTLVTHTQDAKVEAEAVAETFRADLEKEPPKKRNKGHASVIPFGQGKDGALAALDNMDPDERVLSGLDSAHPLAGFRFDNFFPGKDNSFTFELCKAVSNKPGDEYNPFFLYGNVGLGKTHLINAIGNGISEANSEARVGYVSASHFAKCLKDAIQDNALDAFRENYCHWDVLILDDIQFMGGKVEAQEEFFHIFNILHQEARQIIIAGDKAPTKLGLLEQRLVSRFTGGLVADIKPPDQGTRSEILRAHAGHFNVKIPDDVLMMISVQIPDDVRKMIGSLRKIVAFAELVGQDICCEMADEILSHIVPDASSV